MVPKWFVWFCLAVGSSAGAYVPLLWGGEVLSFSSVIFSTIGGLLGIWAAVRISKSI